MSRDYRKIGGRPPRGDDEEHTTLWAPTGEEAEALAAPLGGATAPAEGTSREGGHFDINAPLPHSRFEETRLSQINQSQVRASQIRGPHTIARTPRTPSRSAPVRQGPQHAAAAASPVPPAKVPAPFRVVHTPQQREEFSYDERTSAASPILTAQLLAKSKLVRRALPEIEKTLPPNFNLPNGTPQSISMDAPDSTRLLDAGFNLGNYRIIRPIAKGGMGVVYEARHQYLDKRAAVKILRQSRLRKPDVLRRFFNEAVAATRIGHPGVVEVTDYGHAPDGAAYLVMEFLAGESLADRLDDNVKLSVPESLDIARRVADAMAAAHTAGIVHRDLKPDNIFLTEGDGENVEQLKVLDFGVAKFLEDVDNRTGHGKLLGTPYYMSPEQCQGIVDVDHRSDIYSLGCLLFEMLTGRPPFSGNTSDVLTAHRLTKPCKASMLNPEVPAAVDGLIQQMLAKSPTGRPQSMAQVVAELSLVASGAQVVPAKRDKRSKAVVPTTAQLEDSQRIGRLGFTIDRDVKRKSKSRKGVMASVLLLSLLGLGAAAASYLAYSAGYLG